MEFFATLKKALVHRRSLPTRDELMSEVFEYLEAVYNRTRRHSTPGYLSPADYENRTLITDETILPASQLATPHGREQRQRGCSFCLIGAPTRVQGWGCHRHG